MGLMSYLRMDKLHPKSIQKCRRLNCTGVLVNGEAAMMVPWSCPICHAAFDQYGQRRPQCLPHDNSDAPGEWNAKHHLRYA